jgi:hypothetical protein
MKIAAAYTSDLDAQKRLGFSRRAGARHPFDAQVRRAVQPRGQHRRLFPLPAIHWALAHFACLIPALWQSLSQCARALKSAKPFKIVELRCSESKRWQIQGCPASRFCLIFLFVVRKGPERKGQRERNCSLEAGSPLVAFVPSVPSYVLRGCRFSYLLILRFLPFFAANLTIDHYPLSIA